MLRDRLIETFTRLAEVDSPSRQEGALAQLLIADLRGLGWQARDDASGPDCGNVIATLAGDEALDPLLFTSHMDVVMPCLGVRPRLEEDVFVTGGDTVLGADAKASIAALLETARLLAEGRSARPRPTVELVFTWGEEIGHLGAKVLDIGQLRARRGYVLDALAPVGTIVVAAPTYYAFTIRVIGRAAHAGVEPERGVSAIAVAADALRQLPWGRLNDVTTANVGTIHGGSARNAVAAEVELEGEVRSLDLAQADQRVQAIRETFESVAPTAGADVEVSIRQLYAGYRLADADDVVERPSRAYAGLAGGGPSTLIRSGGGSDANEFNARGLPASVLGIGAEGCHSVQERISVSELERLTAWVLALVDQAPSTA
jgi:tripeptide aminopeptidase